MRRGIDPNFGRSVRSRRARPKQCAERTAAKDGVCEAGCGTTIQSGERYMDVSKMRLCLPCFAKKYES